MYGKDLTGETAGILENLEVVNDDVDAETASFVKGSLMSVVLPEH